MYRTGGLAVFAFRPLPLAVLLLGSVSLLVRQWEQLYVSRTCLDVRELIVSTDCRHGFGLR